MSIRAPDPAVNRQEIQLLASLGRACPGIHVGFVHYLCNQASAFKGKKPPSVLRRTSKEGVIRSGCDGKVQKRNKRSPLRKKRE